MENPFNKCRIQFQTKKCEQHFPEHLHPGPFKGVEASAQVLKLMFAKDEPGLDIT